MDREKDIKRWRDEVVGIDGRSYTVATADHPLSRETMVYRFDETAHYYLRRYGDDVSVDDLAAEHLATVRGVAEGTLPLRQASQAEIEALALEFLLKTMPAEGLGEEH